MKKFLTEAILAFLKARRDEHPGQDLLDRYLAHGCDLETQVNVAAGHSEPVAGKRATWDTGTYQYWNLRIPKNAYDEPVFKDYKLSWPLELHAEGIGSTWWDWKHKVSRGAGFDFDAITGHAAGVGITDEKLDEVRRAAENLPYIEVRRSTGGQGIHLYVLLEGIPTVNHTEHAALARCILGMMTADTGFDFARQIDCCGSVMWLWHRKMTMENRGLERLCKKFGIVNENPHDAFSDAIGAARKCFPVPVNPRLATVNFRSGTRGRSSGGISAGPVPGAVWEAVGAWPPGFGPHSRSRIGSRWERTSGICS